MATKESFHNSNCEDQIKMAERELSAFIRAVTELFGPEQARLSAEDWLDEAELELAELMDGPPRATRRDWRAVTVAASARLANRGTPARDHRKLAVTTDTEARQYYRPIVSHARFWCDDSSQPVQSEMRSDIGF